MANVVSIHIVFENGELAQQALAVAERMIKLQYIPEGSPWAAEAESLPSLSSRYLRYGAEAAALEVLREHPNCALRWLRQAGRELVIERCADIQSPVDVFRPEDFFTQLCMVLSKCFPASGFTAFCRHEETVSATVQLNRIRADHGSLFYEEMWILDGEEFDEDDWTRAYRYVLRETDGVFERPTRRE